MIKSLSPHYINTPWISPALGFTAESYRLKIYVWDGDLSSPPASANYEIVKNNPEALTGDDKISISRLLNDFIEFETTSNATTDLITSPNQRWVKTEIYYKAVGGSEQTFPEDSKTQPLVRGYGYGMDGENPDVPINEVLMQGTEFTVNRGGNFIVPIKIGQVVPPPPSITITAVTLVVGSLYNVIFSSTGTYASFTVVAETPVTTPLAEALEVGATSPISVTLLDSGSNDITVWGYDSASNGNIVSNTFNIIIP